MTTIQIQHSEDDGRGAFFIARDDARVAEMTYSRAGEHLVIVDHTLVHDILRGHGIGRRLLDTLVGWARETNTRVRATCTYALGQFEKDASIQDVFER